MRVCIRVESLVSFLTWSWCNQKRTRAFRTERQCFMCCSTSYVCIQHSVVYDICPPIADTCSKLPDTFALFPVLSLQVRPHIIKVFIPPFYLQCCSWEKKYQALSACTTCISEGRSLRTRLVSEYLFSPDINRYSYLHTRNTTKPEIV